MSLGHPLLLLTLLVVPLAIGLQRLVARRRMRYAVRYTNVEVLAAVVGGRSWRRLVPGGSSCSHSPRSASRSRGRR